MSNKPVPTRLKVLMGNPGKRPIPKGEPMPEVCIPDPPGLLDEYGLAEWTRVTKVLASLGLISELTMPAVVAYCDSYSAWRRANEELAKLQGINKLIQVRRKDGEVVSVHKNPLLSVAANARAEAIRFALEFGGSEIAKMKLAVQPEKKEKSRFDGLIGSQRKNG